MKDFNFKLLANKDYSFLYALSGAGGSILSYSFGGWSGLLEILLLMFAIDYISGCVASLKSGKGLKSSIGFWGLIKKGMMLLMVLLGHRIDLALNMNLVMNGTIVFWISNELVSIFENYGRMKINIPPIYKKIFTIFKDRAEAATKDEDKPEQ
ncbi:phage holin family protein [Paenibacillus donghaensis]|uniref:phage holin family protein n=1 Tax=Paenibacillus donghaensis TaxID=414771 RepID=UPI001FEA16C8|nr:phage holin family protein [Paenibacillus donghaensis]